VSLAVKRRETYEYTVACCTGLKCSVEEGPSSETDSHSGSHKVPHLLWESKSSVTCSQYLVSRLYPESDESSSNPQTTNSVKSVPSRHRFCSFMFSNKILYECFVFPTLTTCLVYSILIELIMLT
jgi:hypothetical protein